VTPPAQNKADAEAKPKDSDEIEEHDLDLRSQFFVSDSFVSNGGNEGIEPFQSMDFDVAEVQSKGELVNVSGKVFRASVMVKYFAISRRCRLPPPLI